ncbi:hypothetical protein GQ43DRAFT_489530 [Delitschia confertaspora ATCC 74209]|uniref:Uncharacterized protein n=1 Tax=Delitschia confertaspora ATCC 74209 TaxID=1513339 RepID=A0A9P4JLI3_9PLEO|nr:hypothetical protein GQ43DRAFT_489530 [Delitschia confertaspora ATCC 74209]
MVRSACTANHTPRPKRSVYYPIDKSIWRTTVLGRERKLRRLWRAVYRGLSVDGEDEADRDVFSESGGWGERGVVFEGVAGVFQTMTDVLEEAEEEGLGNVDGVVGELRRELLGLSALFPEATSQQFHGKRSSYGSFTAMQLLTE